MDTICFFFFFHISTSKQNSKRPSSNQLTDAHLTGGATEPHLKSHDHCKIAGAKYKFNKPLLVGKNNGSFDNYKKRQKKGTEGVVDENFVYKSVFPLPIF